MAINRLAQGEQYVHYEDGNILIKNVRVSFPHISTPFSGKGAAQSDTPKYGFKLLIPKEGTTELVDFLKGQIRKLIHEELKVKKLASDKICLRDGDASGRDEEEGHYTLSANSNRPIVAKSKSGVTLQKDEVQEVIYPGCYVNALIKFWAQQATTWGMRVNANGNAIQFVKDGEPLGSTINPDEYDWSGSEEDTEDDIL